MKCHHPMQKKDFFLSIILTVFIFVLSACQTENNMDKPLHDSDDKLKTSVYHIDTFSVFPPEIAGCSCYYAETEELFQKNHYILMSNADSIAYVKLNGQMIKLKLHSQKTLTKGFQTYTYENDSLIINIEAIDGKQNGDETWLKSGMINIRPRSGVETSTAFYGECGC